MHSLHQAIPLTAPTDNAVYILTYRAKCLGHGGALAGLAILAADSFSYNHLDFVSNSGWALYCDTIAPPSKAVCADVGLMVHKDFSRVALEDLLHPQKPDTNAVLFDDFRLVQQRR